TVSYADREETYQAGDAFYMTPGHVPAAEAGTELVQFSPKEQLAETTAAMMANAQRAQLGSFGGGEETRGPGRTDPARWAAVAGAGSRILAIADLMARVTLSRARSDSAPRRRGLPPSPVAAASSRTRKSFSARRRLARSVSCHASASASSSSRPVRRCR